MNDTKKRTPPRKPIEEMSREELEKYVTGLRRMIHVLQETIRKSNPETK